MTALGLQKTDVEGRCTLGVVQSGKWREKQYIF